METFKWRAEIEFEGTPEEFNKLAAYLDKSPVVIRIPEWARVPPGHLAGCNPLPIEHLIDPETFRKIVEGMPTMRIQFIRDIAGGIRTPHLHQAGEVVLLDRARFRTMVGLVAQALAQRRAEAVEDYVTVMEPVDRLAAIPITLP